MHNIYNVNLRVNINTFNDKSVIYINPIFEDKYGEQFVTDNKCIRINYKNNVQDKDVENCMLETQMYNKGILKENTRFNVDVIYEIPQINVCNNGYFL